MNEGFVFKDGGIKRMPVPVEVNDAAGMPASNEPTKTCPSCGRTLPVSQFHKHARSADGLMNECIECTRRRKEAKKNIAINPLAQFTARQLMDELSLRGYKGELTYTEVKIHKMRIGEM